MDFEAFYNSLKDMDIAKAKSLVTTLNAATRTPKGHGVLTYLCAFGPDDPELLRHFLGLGATLELDNDGIRGSPLKFAVDFSKPKLVRALIDEGMPININDGLHWTPFHQAMLLDDKTCAKILADTGVPLLLSNGTRSELGWTKIFMNRRERARTASIIILGLLTVRKVALHGNGKDVLRMIARCVWGSRGEDDWVCE